MAVSVLDNNVLLDCRAFIVKETVFHHPCDSLKLAHAQRNPNGTLSTLAFRKQKAIVA
jgi:hypothetical protein